MVAETLVSGLDELNQNLVSSTSVTHTQHDRLVPGDLIAYALLAPANSWRPVAPWTAFDSLGLARTRVRDESTPVECALAVNARVVEEAREATEQPQLELCLLDIQRWLGIGLQDAAAAAGINRGTIYAWRRRQSTPRPATVAAVLKLHGLVSLVVSKLGEEDARGWFHSGDPSPLNRLTEATGDRTVFRKVSNEARRQFASATLPEPNHAAAASLEDLEER